MSDARPPACDALRAFTADDATALKAAARTFPKTPFYDVEEKLAARAPDDAPTPAGRAPAREEPSTLERVLASHVTKTVAVTVAGAITRGIMGALLGPPRRRRC